MGNHSVEKIGGTSMADYDAIRDNIILRHDNGDTPFRRIFVVSAYAGITNQLLEHKKSGQPGVYALFASCVDDDTWRIALERLKRQVIDINSTLFPGKPVLLDQANRFVLERLDDAEQVLSNLHRLCQHGHFALEDHLNNVREMLASIGEAHSAWNTAHLLQEEGINTCFVDLTGWKNSTEFASMDERIASVFDDIDLDSVLPVVTGYTHSEEGLMSTFERGYSEMTFSRIAVLTGAREAVIHKEFHLCSADPMLVGAANAVPIGRTNYDVADQLANLGMEAIHPKAAKGLKENNIPLRVKNTFEPEHTGTLITSNYVSSNPRVEIIVGCKPVYAIELFDQNITTNIEQYDQDVLGIIRSNKGYVISKDINANTITHYLKASLRTIKNIQKALKKRFVEAEVNQQEVAIVSAIGSDMEIPGILAKTVTALADSGINALAMHQSMRQVDMQFVIRRDDYDNAIKSLHQCLVEVHDHGRAICLAS